MKILNGRCCVSVGSGIHGNPIHLKTPPLSLLSSVHRALGGLSYSNIVPVNRYVYLFIPCLYMHCLILVIKLCICVSWLFHWERKFCYTFAFYYVEKRMRFCKAKQVKKKNNNTKLIVKTYSGFNRLDADQWDQLIERLHWCGDSILLSCCREGFCYRFFEISSASCYVQA